MCQSTWGCNRIYVLQKEPQEDTFFLNTPRFKGFCDKSYYTVCVFVHHVYLCSLDLSFGKLHVSSEFFHSDTQWLQTLTEVISHLSCQGLHRSHIHYLQT